MWMPPDLGKQYVREMDRKHREEAYLREGRTGQHSELLRRRMGIGQKILVLAGAIVALVVFLVILSAVTAPSVS